MTEVSSTDQAAGADSPRRSPVPAPPRPPRAMDSDDVGTGLFDGGPSTSPMPAVPDSPGELMGHGYGGAYAQPVIGLPAEGVTGIGAIPAVTTLPSDLGAPPPPAPPTGRGYRGIPRPSVKVRGPRRAKLVLRRVDPWSVLKFSFLFSICLLIVWVVAVSSLFSLLRTMHVFDNINDVLASATSDPTSKGVHIDPTSDQVTMWAAILGAVNALLFTALATLGAFLYNMISMLVGGVEVTLAERD